jgi:Uma2 family endonuclease
MAAIAHDKRKWTAEEYLAFERDSLEKHELIDGRLYLKFDPQVYTMAGAKENQNLISLNTATGIHAQRRQNSCRVYYNDMRVQTGNNYTYPDIVVVCGAREFLDEKHDTLLNPSVIIEVLSPSTAKYDRDKKFTKYRAIDSLQAYLLVAQDQFHVMRYVRQPSGDSLLTDFIAPDAIIELPSIGCTLALADVYADVDFEEEVE